MVTTAGILVHKPGKAVKAVARGNGLVEGYLISWGNPGDCDLEGQWFTKSTDLRLEYFSDYPLLFHHGMDDAVGLDPIGRIKTLKKDNIGLWVQAQLDMADKYAQEVYRMAQIKQFGWSSGSIDHLVKIARNGEILVWPLFEGSITPTPAQPHKTTVRALKSVLPQNDPVAVYLRGLQARAGDSYAGKAYLSETGEPVMASTKTKRYVRAVLSKNGYKADEEIVDGIATELEDEALMADEFEDPTLSDDEDDAFLMDDEDEDPTLSDDEDDAFLMDDEDDAMLFDDEDPTLSDDEDDAFLMDDEEPVLSRRKTRRPQKTRRARKSYDLDDDDPYASALELRLAKAQRRIKALEMMEAPGERTRGIKGIQVTKDEADRPGAYKSVFIDYLRYGNENLTPTQKYIMRRGEVDYGAHDIVRDPSGSMKALNISNAGSLGFAVPEDFIPELNKNVSAVAAMAQDCKTRTTSSDRIRQPYLHSGDARRTHRGTGVKWPGESPTNATASAGTEMQLGTLELPIHVALINMPVTLSSLEDVSFNLETEISEYFGEELGYSYETLIWNGNGQGKMLGITVDSRVTGAASTGVASVSGYIASGHASQLTNGDKLKDMMMHLPPQYRGQAKWYMNSNTANIISQFKAGDGDYLWGDEQGLNSGIPTTLLGKPIVYNEFADDIAADGYPIIFAHLHRGYLIGKRIEFSIRRFEDSITAAQDQAMFFGRARIGGQVDRPEAIKVMKIAEA